MSAKFVILCNTFVILAWKCNVRIVSEVICVMLVTSLRANHSEIIFQKNSQKGIIKAIQIAWLLVLD